MSSFRLTDTHIYFLGSNFSQWVRSPFEGFLHALVNGKLIQIDTKLMFTCAEQYMMASKAILFEDLEILEEIMATTNPADHKRLGRKVKNFDADVWNAHARDLVYMGNYWKFTQHDPSKQFLDSVGQRTIVEGADYDPVWGVKLAWDNPKIEDDSNWAGTNWLGQCIMRVREDIKSHGSDQNPFELIRPW